MAAEKKFPLSLVVRAIDNASGPLKSMTARFAAITGPFARKEFGMNLGKLGEALNVGGFMKVGGALKNVGGEVSALVTRFAGLALGAGAMFAAIVKGAMDSGDKLGEMAQRVGLSVDSYASLQHAAAQADVEQEAFNSGMDKFNKQLGDMTVGKGGKFLAFLNEISPTFAKQVKGAKTTEEAFFLVSDAMAKIEDPQRRATLAAAAFGKSNTQMGVFLAQGTKSIKEQQAETLRLHGTYEQFASSAGALDNATRDTALAFAGLRDAAAAGLFPALTKLSNIATEFLVKNREGITKWATEAGASIERWVNGGGLERLGASLRTVADGVGKVVDFLGPVGVAAVAAGVAFGPLAISVGTLGVALIGVMPTLIAFGVAAAPLLLIAGVGVAIAIAGKQIYDAWGPLKQRFEEVGDSLRWSVLDAWEAVRPILAKLAMLPGVGGAFSAALGVGDSAAGQVSKAIESRTGQSVEAIRARQAAAEAARPNSGPRSLSEARVAIDFRNMPKGVNVSTDPTSSQPVNMSVGPQSVLQ